MKKTLAVLLTAALAMTVFAALPADAKKKKKKKQVPCAAFEPGELGTDIETIVVTDAATEEAPVEVEGATAAPGLMLGIGEVDSVTGGHVYYNVQVDTKKKARSFYALLEWSAPAPIYDYDLWAYTPDGTEAAAAHGFNPDDQFSGENNHGESGPTSEKIVGLVTPDCGGYTLDVSTASAPGGAVTLKYWLAD